MASRSQAERDRIPRKQLSLYFSKEAQEQRLLERLEALARRRKRSLNFLVLEALARYLQEEETKKRNRAQEQPRKRQRRQQRKGQEMG